MTRISNKSKSCCAFIGMIEYLITSYRCFVFYRWPNA
nr:MAG TPA: hypothetical protein [Caudoviricetes sp.]